jgi:hypothetical protein
MGVKVAFQELSGQGSGKTSGLAQGVSGVVVPQSAMSESGGRFYVLLVVDNLVERRAVATAGARGKDILVTSGISSGDKVIVNAPASLREGDRVKETNG